MSIFPGNPTLLSVLPTQLVRGPIDEALAKDAGPEGTAEIGAYDGHLLLGPVVRFAFFLSS